MPKVILGRETADFVTVQYNLRRLNASSLFINEMFPEIWNTQASLLIDPVGGVAQSFIETGKGYFTDKVKPEFFNVCGLKNSPKQNALFPGITDGDNPLAHAMFANWEEGALAQAQHLLAYCGINIHMPPLASTGHVMIVDPRFSAAFKHKVEDRCKTWADLGGKWAPRLTYGEDIEKKMDELSLPVPVSEV